MRTCRIWATDNGYGLSRDADIVRPMLEAAGFAVERSSPNRPTKTRTDIAIHLEHIHARNLDRSPINIAVPNVEWCPQHMVQAMKRCTLVIAKTDSAAHFLREAGITSTVTGWTSPDMLDISVPRFKSLVHIAGRSPLKSTTAVMQAMALLPDLRLTLYKPSTTAGVPPNVDHQKVVVPPGAMRPVINRHTIHVIPSQYEGFGHMLNEAASCGARIVTTDHEPMRMFDRRYLVPVKFTRRQSLAQLAIVDPEPLAEAIRKAWDDDSPSTTREGFLARDAAFRAAFTKIIETI